MLLVDGKKTARHSIGLAPFIPATDIDVHLVSALAPPCDFIVGLSHSPIQRILPPKSAFNSVPSLSINACFHCYSLRLHSRVQQTSSVGNRTRSFVSRSHSSLCSTAGRIRIQIRSYLVSEPLLVDALLKSPSTGYLLAISMIMIHFRPSWS